MSPEIIETTFKRNRKGYFLNTVDLNLHLGDHIVVEVENGMDLGKVSQIGRLVMLKDFKSGLNHILRKATEADMQQLNKNREAEAKAHYIAREYIERRNLNMKLVDIEYQFDNNKMTFFFTSDQRVDFRELVKDLAGKYRTRIELRQISVREEARKLGGIGICGKELCCSKFIGNFSPISTNDAKEQNLPLNPSKICGVCNRLKCCILYEKGFYAASLKKFPALDTKIQTDRGLGSVDKIDIFNDQILMRFDGDEYEQYSLTQLRQFIKSSKN